MNQYQQDHGNAPEQVKGRFLVFVIILILMFAYLFAGLVNLQLKSSEGYSTKTESTRLKTIPLTGKRGNITDANSVILATDEMVYNVTFYKDASESSSSVYKTYTQSIIDTLKIIERNGGKLAFSYVIQRSEETGEWEFNFGSGVSDATLQTRESQWRSNNYVTAKSYPTPEDCLVTLKHRYRMVNSAEEEEEVRAAYIEKRGDDSGYVPCIIVDEDTMLKVMAVFSEMQMNLYNSLPVVIAKDVSYATVSEIEGRSMMLDGFAIEIGSKRVYPRGSLASQVIGYVGPISSYETYYSELEPQGYKLTDTIGKDGIELLERAPGVWIDDEKISINGKSGSKVYVNDRELRMEPEQLLTYLRSLRAEEIQKIEVWDYEDLKEMVDMDFGKSMRLSSGNRLTSYLVLDIVVTLLHMHRRRMDTFHQRLIRER